MKNTEKKGKKEHICVGLLAHVCLLYTSIEFFKDDVSTSIDAGDFIRTGVSWLSDH